MLKSLVTSILESEDRKARAKVSLVKIFLRNKQDSHKYSYFNRENTFSSVDPFDVWFNETFKLKLKKSLISMTMYGKNRRDKKGT